MATGRPAFAGSSAVVGAAILHQQPTPVRTLRPDLPEGFEQVVLKALEKDRQLRYQTAADVRADLQRQKRSGDQNAESASVAARPQWRRSKRARVAAAVAALSAAVGVGFWAFTRSSTPKLTETDTIVLSDFTNTTGEAVFDGALRQGLVVQLQQSPFLHVLPDQRVRRVIAMMGLPVDARLTPAVALRVCERSSGAAVIEGSIASLGNQYVLGLRAIDCRSGDVLDTQQSQVPSKEDVLSALSGMGRAFRARVGESLATIQTHEKPLEEATTASLDALKAYSATRVPGFGGCDARIPLLERAVALDPEFALAHAGLGPCYTITGRRNLAIQSATRAYELRHRTTDPERFFIEYAYDRDVTGDLERAFQTATLWTQTYPRDLNAWGLRGGYSAHGTGRYEDVIESAERALAIDPDLVFAHSEAVSANMFLDRFDAAKRALHFELLQANVAYERAVPPTAFNSFFGSLYPVFVRAQAYAANGQHQQAAAELQKMLDHRGLMMGDPAGARALLEKARSLARAGDQIGARAGYQEFLLLWKDADPDVPLLAQAQAEYAKLK
jgi:tetratricopeptide (TPR) repeat protein